MTDKAKTWLRDRPDDSVKEVDDVVNRAREIAKRGNDWSSSNFRWVSEAIFDAGGHIDCATCPKNGDDHAAILIGVEGFYPLPVSGGKLLDLALPVRGEDGTVLTDWKINVVSGAVFVVSDGKGAS